MDEDEEDDFVNSVMALMPEVACTALLSEVQYSRMCLILHLSPPVVGLEAMSSKPKPKLKLKPNRTGYKQIQCHMPGCKQNP